MDEGRIVGVVTRDDVFEAMRTCGDHTLAEEIMRTDFDVAHPDEMLEDVLARSSDSGRSTVPVVSNHRPVGLLTAETISEVFMLRAAQLLRNGVTSPAGVWPRN